MPQEQPKGGETWIIGYGNTFRRDDGIGPYVVQGLRRSLRPGKKVRLLETFQLGPDLVQELAHAERIVFVDATTETLEDGRQWLSIRPEPGGLPYLTHHLKPHFLLGLLRELYRRSPAAWLISIEGRDFRFGEGLSPEAAARARRVVQEIGRLIHARNGKQGPR